MANRLKWKKQVGYIIVGVLETPMFPCSFYGGIIRTSDNREWWPADNGSGYFREIKDALDRAMQMAKQEECK